MNKIRKSEDGTLSRNTIDNWKFLSREYELVKEKKHSKYKFVTDFYNSHNIKRQNFIKYYNRFKLSKDYGSFLPQKRGPKYKSRRTLFFIEDKVVLLRKRGLNRYEIYDDLKLELKDKTPKSSTIYNIFRRYNINKLNPKMKEQKRKIIKTRCGELGHIDCHYLPRNIINDDNRRYYLIALIDSCSRVVWSEAIRDIKAITVMFATLKMLNLFNRENKIRFKEILSDNGSEFGSGLLAKNKDTHPFERLLKEFGIKHRYTKPYRPQTNGKIERFWKTLNEDLLEDVVFDSFEHLEDELLQYCVYYNEARNHQAINDKPFNFAKKQNDNNG